jgi:hypothetical protein
VTLRGAGPGRGSPWAASRALLLAPALLLLCATSAPAGDTGVAPGTSEIAKGPFGAWVVDGPVRLFRGAELYGHIDGGAEIFFELGFEELAVVKVRQGERALNLELYQMRDPAAALGIYLMRCGKETPDRSLAARNTAGPSQLQAVRGSYYLSLDNDTASAALARGMVEAARELVARLGGAAEASVFGALPTQGRLPGSERVIRGPVGLGALITLGDGDILEQKGAATGVLADYLGAPAEARYTLLLVDYPDAPAATHALGHLKAHLDPEIKVMGGTDTSLSFLDYSGREGRVEVREKRLELRLASAPASR